MKNGYTYFELIFFLLTISILIVLLCNSIFEMQKEIKVLNTLFDDCLQIRNEYETKGKIDINSSFTKKNRTIKIDDITINLITLTKNNINIEFIQSISY
jgi:hypothetical protein